MAVWVVHPSASSASGAAAAAGCSSFPRWACLRTLSRCCRCVVSALLVCADAATGSAASSVEQCWACPLSGVVAGEPTARGLSACGVPGGREARAGLAHCATFVDGRYVRWMSESGRRCSTPTGDEGHTDQLTARSVDSDSYCNGAGLQRRPLASGHSHTVTVWLFGAQCRTYTGLY